MVGIFRFEFRDAVLGLAGIVAKNDKKRYSVFGRGSGVEVSRHDEHLMVGGNVARGKAVGMVEKGKVLTIKRIERAVDVGVILGRGSRKVAYNGFVFDTPQRDKRGGKRVDDGGSIADLPLITRCIPVQATLGREVLIIVERGGERVVEPIHIPICHRGMERLGFFACLGCGMDIKQRCHQG